MSTIRNESSRLKDLLRLLDVVRGLYETLEKVIVAKIDAIRRADVPAMQAALDDERTLTERLREREGLRRQLMDAIGNDLGLPHGAGRTLTVSRMAAKMAESPGAALRECADALRRATARTAQANRVAAVITRELVSHMQWVFASVRPAGGQPAVYTDCGKMMPMSGTVLLETVG